MTACSGCVFTAAPPIATNWSRVGSAQQYHGSLKNGTARPSVTWSSGASIPAAKCAASQIRKNAAARDSFFRSASAAIPCTVSLSKSTRQSAFFHGYTSDSASNAPTIRRTSSNSSNREPSGISNRIPSWIAATFSINSSAARTRSNSKYPSIVIHRLHRADHKQASRIAQPRQVLLLLPQMLNLDGHIVSNAGKLGVKRLHQLHRVPYPIKKVRIAKRNVLRTRRHLLPNIRQHHLALHNAKHTVVDRHNRAMPAKMLAPPASFRRPHHAIPVTRHHQVRILSNRRQSRPIRHLKFQPLHRNHRLGLIRKSCRGAL